MGKERDAGEILGKANRLRGCVSSLDFTDDTATDYEQALLHTGFGWFHYNMLALCGMIYMNTAIGVTILSFVLPVATCDFQMTSSDKGWLTAAPMLGMLVGSYFWGCLADTKGRKRVLIATLLGDALCGLVSSLSQHFLFFLLVRLLNGFNVAGAMGICFPYLGEFQPTKYREKILCWMEMFWTVGIIVLPLIAWGIIPLEIKLESRDFTFHSWNLFVAVCALPSLFLGLWLFTFPESPKFLLEVGEPEKALAVLKHMYEKNTGEPKENFPYTSLVGGKTLPIDSVSVRRLNLRRPKELRILIGEIWTQTKTLCTKPFLRTTILTCLIQFGLTSSYYTLMVWFPELFQRFADFEELNPGAPTSVCEVSSVYTVNGTTIVADLGESCDSTIQQGVYRNTVIIGLACIPTSFWLPLCVHRLGIKFFLVFGLVASAAVTIGLYFVQNAWENLVLSCIFEALTSLTISTVYCVMVDLFPTNLRVMAAALSMTFGRGGALLGNLLFGFLIDFNCVVPIVIFAVMLAVSGLLCLLLPSTGNEALA